MSGAARTSRPRKYSEAFDTPTIYGKRAGSCGTQPGAHSLQSPRPMVAPLPAMKPVVAFARHRDDPVPAEPHPRGNARGGHGSRWPCYEHVATRQLNAQHRCAVIQDLDGPDAGLKARFWGEVSNHVHKSLGCAGVVTDGSVRDLDVLGGGLFRVGGLDHTVPRQCSCGGHRHDGECGSMVVSPDGAVRRPLHGAVNSSNRDAVKALSLG